MASNMGNSIMLRNSEDWESFWFALEGIAGSSDTSVFKFIDVYDNANLLKSPELPKIPKAPDLPERPEVTLERNEVQTNQLYTTLLTEHRFLHAAYLEEKTKISKQLERYDALSGWVRQHVHPDNFIYMRNEQTLFKQLLALKKQFAPTDRARELRVTRLYNDALVYGDNEPVIRWLDNYQHVYEKAKEVNLPEITGYRAHYDFINAIKSIDAEYSKYLSIQLEKKRKKNKVPYLTEIIEDFRNHQRQEQESVETDRDFRNKTRAVAATFKEDFELRSNEHSEKNKQKYNEKECLCGSIHAWVKCFYLNPSLRTTTWKGKKEVYEKINKLLKNPKLKWVIKKYGYDGFKNEKTEETDHNIPNTGAVNFRSINQKAAAVLTTRQSISISEESLWSQHVFSLNKKVERQFDDNFHLSNKWIIDNGADTHVANSTRNFEETKKANEGEVLYAGKGAYLIESYGNVVLPLKSDVIGEYLLLKDVAYVPGFMTNCVSLDKLTKANIHWNSRNPSILEREGDSSPFCYLFQSGSHWVFDEPEPNTVMSSSKRKNEETVDFLAGIEIPNDESGEYVDEMEEWDYVPNIGENLDDSDRQFSPETNTAKELDTSEKVIASGNTDGENKLPTPSATPSPLRRAVDYNSCTDPNIVESKINESRINVDKSLPKSWVEAVDHESPTLLASKAGSSAEIDTNNILQGKRQRNKRTVQVVASEGSYKSFHYDAVNAYGNSRRKIPLYTKCPPGFEDRGDGLLIFFGMYGLKPSALDWYNTYKSAALEIGLSVVPDSPCIFQNDWLIMIVYVDDILIAYHPHHEDRFREFELKFLQIFEFRKLGKVEHFIGIRFVRDESERKLWLVQDVFISKLEQKFKVNTQTKHRTPLPSGSLKAYDGIATPSQVHHYQQK
ncbi:hypothetical protein GcC1_018019, partial [Golovinomyces cichoracearum]